MASAASQSPVLHGSRRAVVSAPRERIASPPPSNLERILKLGIPVSVTLAERNMTVDAILAMNAGTIIEFGVPSDAELSLRVGHRTIGMGHAVKSGEKFGLRLTSISTVEDRIDAMGPSVSSPSD